MGDVRNYGKREEEKLVLIRAHRDALHGAHDKDYLKAIEGKPISMLTPNEIYRVVQIYDNNHQAIEEAAQLTLPGTDEPYPGSMGPGNSIPQGGNALSPDDEEPKDDLGGEDPGQAG